MCQFAGPEGDQDDPSGATCPVSTAPGSGERPGLLFLGILLLLVPVLMEVHSTSTNSSNY